MLDEATSALDSESEKVRRFTYRMDVLKSISFELFLPEALLCWQEKGHSRERECFVVYSSYTLGYFFLIPIFCLRELGRGSFEKILRSFLLQHNAFFAEKFDYFLVIWAFQLI